MTTREKLLIARQAFFDNVENTYLNIASKFGYPEPPGMPLYDPDGYLGKSFFTHAPLPLRKIPYPPQGQPENFFEIIFGVIPKISTLERHYYASKTEGFYNFYIENYRNLFFLPNWFSEILQIQFGYCIDITFLEVIREVLFLGLMGYIEIVVFRIILSWLISINPYTAPWNYFIVLVDWVEESFIGLVPTVAGVNLGGPIFLALLGKCADTLNHLVFTMPFLPSEGYPLRVSVKGDIKDVLVFHFLPLLWYKHPIPDEIREFWYTERPDILQHLETAYTGLGIQFLPDRIVELLSNN